MKRQLTAVFLVVLAGCESAGRVQRQPPWTIPSVDQATVVRGDLTESIDMWTRARLPHVRPAEAVKLQNQALAKVTSHLGSGDYVIIGDLEDSQWGGSQDALIDRMRRHAGKRGGHVLFVFRSGTESERYAYTTPGQATSTVEVHEGLVINHGLGSPPTGDATVTTKYQPSTTTYGTHYHHFAQALVLRYSLGAERRRTALEALDEASLKAVLDEFERINADPTLTFDGAQQRKEEALRRHGQEVKPSP